jgi:3-dehydroquinate dehydratase/shikimate dehydrogenase
MVEDVDAAMRDAALAKAGGADLVEFRVDHIFHGSGGGVIPEAGEDSSNPPSGGGKAFDTFGAAQCKRLCTESPLPCIITCRSAAESGGVGGYDGDDASRVSLYEHLGTLASPQHPPRYLDIEFATYSRSANLRQKVNLSVDFPARSRDLAPGLILSAHDFNGRPANLTRTVASMDAEPAAAVNKIAFRARSLRDNLELFDLLRHARRPTIALAIGEFGLMSRVLAPKFGGFLTFAALRDQTTTAPGQPTLAELTEKYRFRSINPKTKVYGVIGWPLGHSLSPKVHNAGFELRGHDGVYLPLPIPEEWEHFKATLGALLDDTHLDFRGASVTLPHKEHLLRFAREDRSRRWTIDPTSARCGAANTLVVHDDGSCEVSNTDAPAAVASLESVIGPVHGKRVAVIGAGGVARAVACGLLQAGATVVVYNRTAERAERLVADLKSGTENGRIVVGPWDKLAGSCCEAFVNCTPVGMKGGPAPDQSPLPEGAITACHGTDPGPAVMDTVYSPLDTPLRRQARGLGLRTIDGSDMFVRQAVMQLAAWTGGGGTSSGPSAHDLYMGIVQKALAALSNG